MGNSVSDKEKDHKGTNAQKYVVTAVLGLQCEWGAREGRRWRQTRSLDINGRGPWTPAKSFLKRREKLTYIQCCLGMQFKKCIKHPYYLLGVSWWSL